LDAVTTAELVAKMASALKAARDEGAVEAHLLWQSGALPAKPV
jgi:hypothetical protein